MVTQLDDLVRRFLRGLPERSGEAANQWLEYEEGRSTDLRGLKRILHTLKGEAQMLGLERMSELLRQVEEVAVLAQRTSVAPRDIGNVLLEAFDAVALLAADPDEGEGTIDIAGVLQSLGELITQLRELAAEDTGAGEARAKGDGESGSPRQRSISVAGSGFPSESPEKSAERPIDNALRIGDVQPCVHELSRLYEEQSRLQQRMREIQSLLRAVVAEMDPSLPPAVLGEQVIKTLGATAELERRIAAVRAEWSANAFATGLSLDQLSEVTRKAAVVSVSVLRATLERTARATARALSKDVTLRVEGDAHIDARGAEQLETCLLHAIRNAVDHGIEAPEARLAAGKPAHGTIVVRIEQQPSAVHVVVEDDGAGVDLESVRARYGMSASVSDRQALRVLLQSGVSTRTETTDISGRGVGLDVLAREAQASGGAIELESTFGKGFRLTLMLPTVMRADLVVPFNYRGHRLAIPSRNVESFHRLTEVVDTAAGAHVHVVQHDQEDLLPLYTLAPAFGEAATSVTGSRALVIRHQGTRFVLAVDEYGNPRPLPFQPTEELAFRSALVRAAAATPEGVYLLLNVDALSLALRGVTAWQAAETRRETKVVVVEDAPVARELLSGILRSFGLSVSEAAHGVEGLARIRQIVPDMVLTDIEMPYLSGLEMIAQLRAEPRFAALPIVVLSTDTSEETRRRAQALNVAGILSKQKFVEHELRRVVDRCIAGRGS